jgi:hypothetical protein
MVRYPALEVEAKVEAFENGRGKARSLSPTLQHSDLLSVLTACAGGRTGW